MQILLLLVLSIAAVYAKEVTLYGDIRQVHISAVCTCGNADHRITVPVVDDDCVPHVITTLNCDAYTYTLTAWICPTYVGVRLGSPQLEESYPCNIDNLGVGANCQAEFMNGLCAIKASATIEDVK